MDPQWLQWARELQAIAQNGLHFAESPYDVERYRSIQEIAAQILTTPSGLTSEQILEMFAQETGYATPKVDVRGVVFQEGQILLVQEKSDGRWTLPGGWADVNDRPSQAVEREILEEAGYRTRAVQLLALYDRSQHAHYPPYPFHIYKLFFLCEILSQEQPDYVETLGAQFFYRDALPELSIGRVTADQIQRMFRYHDRPEHWSTEFD